jgi:N-hydroxyarylamine O-acetyltransferase
MDVAAYLARIRYSGDTTPSADTLHELHRAHMFAVPFENLDIRFGRRIPIDSEAAICKIVGQRRGGFCYELNGAFAALLTAMGFQVTLLSARVPRPDGSLSPEFDHLTLCVQLEHRWIADVGFGDSFREPLILHPRLDQDQGGERYRIVDRHPLDPLPDEGRLWIERSQGNGDWKPLYTFTRHPRQLSDFGAMCHYHQSSPESHFTKNAVCSLATPDGRITLSDMKWIETRHGNKEERVLADENERRQLLLERFGVSL